MASLMPHLSFYSIYLGRYSQNRDGSKVALPVMKGLLTANGISVSLGTIKYFHGNK